MLRKNTSHNYFTGSNRFLSSIDFYFQTFVDFSILHTHLVQTPDAEKAFDCLSRINFFLPWRGLGLAENVFLGSASFMSHHWLLFRIIPLGWIIFFAAWHNVPFSPLLFTLSIEPLPIAPHSLGDYQGKLRGEREQGFLICRWSTFVCQESDRMNSEYHVCVEEVWSDLWVQTQLI